jgi:uncharacterized protein
VLIGAAVFVVVVVIFGRALARFYVEALWFDGLGQSGVFWGAIRARLTLFAMFFVAFAVLAGVNVAIADKLAPSRFPTNPHPFVDRLHELFGRRLNIYRYAVAAAFAVLMALPASTQWQAWLLYRNAQSFGTSDAEFGVDVGFYVFELPFINFVLDWLFFAVILVLLITLIVHVLNGGVMFASPIPTLSAGARGHLAVLLAVLAALKAADYWVDRYEATNETRGFVQGATYAVVNAQLPALLLLSVVAIVTAALYLTVLRTESWRLPIISSAIWLVLAVLAGYIYPAAVQGLVVNPNQQSREAPFIERNVFATREAMGLTDTTVSSVDVSFQPLSAESIAASDLQPLVDVRLLNPNEFHSRFQIEGGQEAGLTFDDVDVDRYDVDGDGEVEQVLISARELDLDGVANRSWQGRHLINTRGCGVDMAPAGRVRASGRPAIESEELRRPELYFSPSLTSYAVAGTAETERSCAGNEDYTGTAGVQMSSFVRRLAFGLAFMDYNVLASGAIESDSQMLWVRNVRDRVEKLAPFLSFDGDPYPVVIDGTVQWVVDGYTSTSRYPYAQAVGEDVALSTDSGIPRDANYVRNSVKAVVDAYDGSVTLYVVDDDDPIIQAWMSAFPDLFTPGDDMPAELRAHLRYPEDLFRVQTNVYSKYQLEPARFFDRDGAWSVAQAPAVAPRDSPAATAAATQQQQQQATDDQNAPEFATETSNLRFVPYYTMVGSGATRDFVLLRPFVPFSRDDQRRELQAYMTASSDPDSYGQLTVHVVDDSGSGLPEGPLSVANSMESDPEISEEVTLQNSRSGGSRVRFGDLQLVNIADGLLWVRPFYVSVEQDSGSVTSVNDYEFIMATYDERSVYATTLGGALAQLFPCLQANIGERSDTPVTPVAEVDRSGPCPTEPAPSTAPDGSTDASSAGDGEPATAPTDLLAQAETLLRDAEENLRVDGDLGAYQQRVNEAARLVGDALDQLDSEPGSTTAPGVTDTSEPSGD